MPRPDKPNETTNTPGGINTPAEREDNAATDPIANAVEGFMDNIQEAFGGGERDKPEAGR